MSLHVISGLAILLPAAIAFAQQTVTIPVSGQPTGIAADEYGRGSNWVILAHGGRFTKESWKRQAEILANSGFAVLAISFRGDSTNTAGSPNATGSTKENADDVLAAVAYLYQKGSTGVAAIGASFGGDAVGDANAQSPPGRMPRIVILGSDGGATPEKLNGRKLFLVAHDDKNAWGLRLPDIQRHFEKVPEPKKLVVVAGSAHAQYLFETEQAPYVMDRILRFLSER